MVKKRILVKKSLYSRGSLAKFVKVIYGVLAEKWPFTPSLESGLGLRRTLRFALMCKPMANPSHDHDLIRAQSGQKPDPRLKVQDLEI